MGRFESGLFPGDFSAPTVRPHATTARRPHGPGHRPRAFVRDQWRSTADAFSDSKEAECQRCPTQPCCLSFYIKNPLRTSSLRFAKRGVDGFAKCAQTHGGYRPQCRPRVAGPSGPLFRWRCLRCARARIRSGSGHARSALRRLAPDAIFCFVSFRRKFRSTPPLRTSP